MKITALRVRNVGRFAAPVALEGLSGRFDILVGHNETGKSTLFSALHALFTLKHTTTDKKIELLRPYIGGEPYVEADLDIGGRRYRLAKQFGRGRSASLIDCAIGRAIANGADVDAKLHALSGSHLGALGLVWVPQTASLEKLQLDSDETGVLTSAIAREVSSAAGGRHARIVRAQVNKDLDMLMTDKRTAARSGGPLHAALLRRQSLRNDLEAAHHRATEVASATARLGGLRQRLAELTNPLVVSERESAAAKAASRVLEGEQAQARLAVATTDLDAKRLVFDKADAALAAFDRLIEERDLLRNTLAELETLQEAKEGERRHFWDEAEAADAELALLSSEAGTVRAELDVIRRSESARMAARRLTELSRAYASAQDILHQVEATGTALASNTASAALVGQLESIEQEFSILQGRLDGVAPRIRINYLPGAMGRISLEGQPLPHGVELRATKPTTLVIAGIGEISIAGADNHETIASELDALLQRRQSLLEQLATSSLDTARRLLAERREGEAALQAMRGQFRALAPDGLAELKARMAQEQEVVSAAADLPEAEITMSAAECQARLVTIERTASARRERRDQLRRNAQALSTAVAGLKARSEMSHERLGHLEILIPAPSACAQAREALLSTRQEASAASANALMDQKALAASTPEASLLARWRQEAGAARDAVKIADRERQEIVTEIAGLEGQLSGHSQDDGGIELRVRALEGELSRADADVAHHEREVNILKLLDEALAAAARGMRQRLLGPVIHRLQPYVDEVLPGARIEHGMGYAPAELARDGATERLDVLSHGTQEQIAILARMGLARLMADTGHGLPLVLDDALVYSDDDRIGAMGRALERAAGHHQVIVLTCRSQAFAGAIATRLNLSAWTGDA